MSSSQSANTPRREKLLWAFLLLILGMWACFSYTNWISDSEFWPVTLSGHWDQWRNHPALIYKALFHGSLSWIYFFDLDSIGHLKVVKAFYSLLGAISFVLFFKILKTRTDSIKAFLVTMLFLFSNLGFSQIGTIRSDFLSFLFFELALLSLINLDRSSWKKTGWMNLGFSILLVFITPKAIYFSLILAVFSLIRLEKNLRLKLINMFLGFACFGALAVFIFSHFDDAFLLAVRFGLESRSDESGNFWFTPSPRYLMNDMYLIALIGAGWIFQIYQIVKANYSKDETSWISLGLISLAFLLLHKPALPFFIGSFWGLFFLSLLPVIEKIRIRYLGFFLATSLAVFIFRFSEIYHYSNKVQYQAIHEVEKTVLNIPHAKLFDGLGVAPRAPQVLAYLGPQEKMANLSVFILLMQEKPALIINTHRMVLIEADVNDYLIKNYKSIGIGYWLRNDLEGLGNLNNIKSAFHVFGFYPIPQMLEL